MEFVTSPAGHEVKHKAGWLKACSIPVGIPIAADGTLTFLLFDKLLDEISYKIYMPYITDI